MRCQQQDVLVFGEAQEQSAQQWSMGQVERTLGLLRDQVLKPGLLLRVHKRQLELEHGSNVLNRAAVNNWECRSQRFVAPDDFVDAVGQYFDIEQAINVQGGGNVVCGAGRL